VVAAVRAAGRVLDAVDADVVVGFGSYVALPAYLAARRRRTPIVVHEANARPGLANRVGARLTRHVGVAVEGTRLPHARVVGMPLRTQISGLDRAATRQQARAHFGLDPELPTLLVFGGSQGARSLNVAAAGAAPQLAAAGVQVLHAIGPRNTLQVDLSPGSPPYLCLPYIDRMDLAYAAADFALSRAGMTTVAELGAVGLPAAFVPLPIGNGEQRLNALPTVEAGGGLLVEDASLSAQWIVDTVVPILTDPDRLAEMVAAAGLVGRRDGDLALADLVREAVRR
jgi:UDP-N-acetylglucosamine--N-acetylmuramyl-(pentapeptide) pyrophosphoryl-undecaprenol N-acetylglucosamine transferase